MKYIGLILSIILLLSYNENIMSQNIIKPKYSDAYEVEQIISMKGDYVVFKRAGTEFGLNKKEIQYVIHEELGLIYGSINNNVKSNIGEIKIDTLDLSDYKGFLLKEGNKVYIPIDSPKDYERAGALSLKDAVKEYSFWVSVDNIYESHFILEYIVDTNGPDNAYFKIISRDGLVEYDLKKDYYFRSDAGFISTSEDMEENSNVAIKLHKKYIEPLYKIIKKGSLKNKYPKYLIDFIVNTTKE